MLIDEAKIFALVKMAQETGVFGAHETDILREILEDYRNNGEKKYFYREEAVDGRTAGFILYGRTPLTAAAWDIYWVVVDKKIQSRGIGTRLIAQAEAHMREQLFAQQSVVRIETSSRAEYGPACKLYEKNGYALVGRISGFYSAHDDLLIFSKKII
ncbi:MAG: GNAT family N-acetyltransferase [Candidatus Omnitrophica bacterium]|nr:GNAT family N-acetyltransferase [Candidatus Omnitrophota bacterium]